MATHISHSEAETVALGEQWGREAKPGWVFGLSGDLGAGKTLLVKGIARGLGVTELVLSPTFALIHQYMSGRCPLFHLDLYRLTSRREIIAAGLEEYLFQPPGVVAVEWIERWENWDVAPGPAAGHYRQVKIEQLNEQDRRIVYEDIGT